MAQQLEPVTFDEFLSNAASIFAQIEQGGRGQLASFACAEHYPLANDTAFQPVQTKRVILRTGKTQEDRQV